MNKEELLEFIKSHPDNFSIQLKRHHSDFYKSIDQSYDFPKFGEKLYHYIHGNNVGKCSVCGKQCKFGGFHKGYRKRCSYACLNGPKKLPPIVKECPVCKKSFETDKRHNRVTCSIDCQNKYAYSDEVTNRRMRSLTAVIKEKYGVDHVSLIPGIIEKIKKTKLEKYGSETYCNIEKSRKTRLNKYGSENYNNIEKFKDTMTKIYGVDNPSKIKSVIEKSNQTKLNKFGETMISKEAMEKLMGKIQNKEIGFGTEIYKNSLMEKYGVDNPMKNPDIANKTAKTEMDAFYNEIINGNRLGENIEALFTREEYCGTKEKNGKQISYKFRCKVCNTEFFGGIDRGKRSPICRKCNPTGRSKQELEILEFIQSILPIGCEIRISDRQLISPWEIDFYIPIKSIAIEFDGIMWHSEAFGEKSKHYHIMKTKLTKDKGVKLIHIWELEWKNKKEIVKEKIRNILGVSSEKRLYARNCVVSEISSDIAKNFLSIHHIQGADKSSIQFGAYFGDELVSVMTFGKRRIALGKKSSDVGEYEMYRFSIGNKPVVGAAGKLLSAFIKKYKPTKITTYADIRYSGLSAFYEKVGFKYIGTTVPNYWYFHKSDPYKLKHRFSFRKNVLSKKLPIFDPSLSEWENMKANGFDRIWDCGNLKYVWTAT